MKIAIQGHPFRGHEVIQILESLGGKNTDGLEGTYDTFYYIDDKNEICDDHKKNFLPTYKLYTLEEFKKEFPFKIGDIVLITGAKSPNEIIALELCMNRLCYKLNNGLHYDSETLTIYKEMKKERNITLTLDKAKEWYKKGGELKEIALQAFNEKELNPLPRSWEEFCKQGNPIASWRYNIPIKYEALFKLEQLRNCWWNGWKPEWNNCEKYVIKWDNDDLIVFTARNIRAFLVFPTREMAYEFLKCFRYLIEQARDLI